MNRKEFDEIIEWFRSDDPLTYEGGYYALTDRVDDVLDWLMELEAQETDDRMKEKFVELIGKSESPQAIDLMRRSLKSSVYEVRMWAYQNLTFSSKEECKEITAEFKKANPNEEFL